MENYNFTIDNMPGLTLPSTITYTTVTTGEEGNSWADDGGNVWQDDNGNNWADIESTITTQTTVDRFTVDNMPGLALTQGELSAKCTVDNMPKLALP